MKKLKREPKVIRKVALMQFDATESAIMAELDTLWLQTMDLEHINVLAYPIDIMVEKVEERYPQKYINMGDFYDEYKSEDGARWLVGKSVSLADIDAFFQAYFHMSEEASTAA